MSQYNTPLYVYEPHHDDNQNINIRQFLVVLPDIDILKLVDAHGKFSEGVVKQIIEIIRSYNNNVPTGVVVNESKQDDLTQDVMYTSDDDLLMICFIKEYQKSTQTACALLKNKKIDVSDTNWTNKLFSDNKIKFKLDVKIGVKNKSFAFASYGKVPIEEGEIDNQISKIE